MMAKGVSFKGAENVVMVYNPVNKLKHSELYTLKIILRLAMESEKKRNSMFLLSPFLHYFNSFIEI